MRLRLIIFILALIAFSSASLGGWLYYHSYREAGFQRTQAEAQTRLKLLSGQLSAYLSGHVNTVETLSMIRELRTAVENTNLETIYQANQVLDIFKSSLKIDVCYLMDIHGITLCSSNRNHHDSFVGKDFSFRPYYHSAIKGEPSTYLALGTTSLKRGVYYSHPVYAKDNTTITGVAVIKSSVEFVETSLFETSDDTLLFIDPVGVVFITNKDEFRFKLLWKLDEQFINHILDSRQFGNGPWEWTGFTQVSRERVVDAKGVEFLMSGLEVPRYEGWRLISLRNRKQIEKLATEPFIRVIGPVVFLVTFLAGTLVFILYQLASREISQRKQVEEQLRISEERYRHIYHKTPVMLHSIDTEGRIIRVSDHWVERMGFSRQEAIGKDLIDFFSPESRKFAENVIFPRFFSTGMCKDIPYTMVKKNKETMDVMLSCYGVRDELTGKVVRSLAVSVDVTEKNKTQKDLQAAKEKLSQYSQDLEQQVQNRTAQLEKAQDSLKKLSTKIIASQEREKELVARELHDHLGQVLTALRMDTVWIEKHLVKTDKTAAERAARMKALIDETIQDVRNMAHRLRPRVLDDLGLVDALDALVSDFENRSNVSCIFQHDPIPRISNTLATAFYRIGQEAVTNAIRHSGATTILVELRCQDENLVLIVKDDGRGFNPDKQTENQGFGLEGMRERANLVGGILTISSSAFNGTQIAVTAKG